MYLKELEEQRKGLVRFIEQNHPQGSVNNSVTIFFDGRTGYADQSYSYWIKVIFSKEESADTLIKKAVEKATNKKNIVVVTNDRDIQFSVRAQGAKFLSVQDFLGKSKAIKSRQKQKKDKNVIEGGLKRISKTVEDKINKEFQDIWLNKKRKR